MFNFSDSRRITLRQSVIVPHNGNPKPLLDYEVVDFGLRAKIMGYENYFASNYFVFFEQESYNRTRMRRIKRITTDFAFLEVLRREVLATKTLKHQDSQSIHLVWLSGFGPLWRDW